MSVILTGHHNYYGAGKKAYVAQITGRDAKFTFAREFLANGENRRDARAEVIDPGLYETRSVDKKERVTDAYTLVLEINDELSEFDASKADALKITKLLDDGRPFDTIVEPLDDNWGYMTKKRAERVKVSQEIDDVVRECWAHLRSMSEAQKKKVLTALRLLCSPPKPVTEVPVAEVPAAE